MNGPCLCGDPECVRCFGSRPVFHVQNLADVTAAWMYTLGGKTGPVALDGLAPVDVANLIELTIHATRAKLAGGNRAILTTERELDSELAQRVFDLIREHDIDAAVRAAERQR